MQYVNFVHGLITVSQTIVGRRPSSYFLDTLTPLYTWRCYYKKGNYSRTVVSVPRPPAPIQHSSNSIHPTASEICYLREDGARSPSSYFLDTLTYLYTWRSYYEKGNYSRMVASVEV